MVCMLTHSRHSVIHFGGIGVMVHTAGAGTMVGAGVVLIMLGDIIRAIGAAGMAATGVAGMVVDIGDIIIIGTAVLAGTGAAVGLVRLIQTVVRMDKAVTEILLLYVDMVQAPLVLVVLLFGQLVARLVPPDQLMAGEQAQQDAWYVRVLRMSVMAQVLVREIHHVVAVFILGQVVLGLVEQEPVLLIPVLLE